MKGTYAVTNVTTAIVPHSGMSRRYAPIPTTTALNAATIETPKKYCRSDCITFPVIVCATAKGTPMLRSMKRRTVGPSLSKKSVLKTENVRKKTSDVSPWMPRASPWRSVVPASETLRLASLVALEVSFTPASLIQPSA